MYLLVRIFIINVRQFRNFFLGTKLKEMEMKKRFFYRAFFKITELYNSTKCYILGIRILISFYHIIHWLIYSNKPTNWTHAVQQNAFWKRVFAFVFDIFVEFQNDLIYGYIILNLGYKWWMYIKKKLNMWGS